MLITKTPLRISLAGGGTDLKSYYQTGYGAVLSFAIDKYIYILINKKFDNTIRLSYSKTENVSDIQDLQHEIAKECLQMVGITGGIEITSIADIPSGTGLGSSSCYTVGLLNALYAYTGTILPLEELARRACEIEIDILKHPIGKQDQYACACGGMNYFQFNQDDSVNRQKIILSEQQENKLNSNLILFYTDKKHNANSILKKQNSNTVKNLKDLDFLRNQAALMRDDIRENGITDNIGHMLFDGWNHKKKLCDSISDDNIDYMYNTIMQNGAIGGKLLGAGGGGFILAYAEPQFHNQIENALNITKYNIALSKYGSRVIYSE